MREKNFNKKHNFIKEMGRFFKSALVLLLCICITGCNNILGDGEVSIVTAPPLVTPKVANYNGTEESEVTRFDIGGTDAFYLLPGIENYPDNLQDFLCLDYTSDGYFVYYYCAPAYISIEEIEQLNDGEFHEAPNEAYPTYDESATSTIDATIIMAYNPDTRMYKVIDAHGYDHITANTESEGKAKTGIEFYKSSEYNFYTLSHCYGCKISGSDNYFFFDQSGNARIYNSKFELMSDTNIGGLLDYKIKELEDNIKNKYDEDDDISKISSDIGQDLGSADEIDDAINELSEATGQHYDTGNTKIKDLQLKYLIKSAVMDSTGKIYLTLMIYVGESPWSSVILFNRVCSVTSIDLSKDFTKIISVNKAYEYQKAAYIQGAAYGVTMDSIRNGDFTEFYYNNSYVYKATLSDNFTQFYNSNVGTNFFVAGLPMCDLHQFNQLFINLPADYIYKVMEWLIDTLNNSLIAQDLDDRVREVINLLQSLSFIPLMGTYDKSRNIHRSDFNDSPNFSQDQCLMFLHVTADDRTYGTRYWSPRIYPILNTKLGSGNYDKVYYEPYEYNDEIVVYKDVSTYVQDETNAGAIYNEVLRILSSYTNASSETIQQALEKYADEYDNGYYLFKYLFEDSGISFSTLFPDVLYQNNYDKDTIYHAIKGEYCAPQSKQYVKDEELSIPAGTFPISYRLVFPEGSYSQAADLDVAEGSSTSSIEEGVLLFYDIASINEDSTSYKSGIRYERESGKVFEDANVNGSAIDTGILKYQDKNSNLSANILMLITNQGVKLYNPKIEAGGYSKQDMKIYSISYSAENSLFIENEKLLSSTGFTPYTEATKQAAVSERMDKVDLSKEKYNEGNSVNVTEKDVTLTLNSSRVGTIQSASSFTAMSNNEILISAYDSGLSLLRLTNSSNFDNAGIEYEVLHLQNGSYYQSFLDEKNNNYKIVGFDTEDFMYGALDIARAKVYNFNFDNERKEILDIAMITTLDQMAIDYIRRLHRTRVDIEEDADGNITSQKTIILPFEDDHSEEAESERKLFASDEATAKSELNRIIEAKGLTSSDKALEYLLSLREKVKGQQQALNEILSLTKVSKLGSKLNSDVYWVGIQERLQYTTDMGDFLDILAEMVTEESMVNLLSVTDPEAAEIYREFKETLNYQEEEKAQNEVLAEVNLEATTLEKMLDEAKDIEDYEEQYSELDRGQEKETDPLEDALNTDGIMKDPDSKEDKPDRMEIRALIIEDIENYYFEINPLEPEKVYAPDGSYSTLVTQEREDEVWDEYLKDLLSKVNPDNMAAARDFAATSFAELSYTASRTVENGEVTDNAMTVSDDIKEKMKQEILDGLDECETTADVEALFFGTQITNLGNPYGNYRDSFLDWKTQSYATESEKAKAMRSSDWYQKLYELITTSSIVKASLDSKGQSWSDYIQAVFTNKTGNVLRDDQTGETASAHTTAASTFAQLVEFLCEGAGEVDEETKINMVEDLLIGLESLSGADTIEEAIMIERMTLPAYRQYLDEYEAFNKKDFSSENSAGTSNSSGSVSVTISSESSIRRKELMEQEFYKVLIESLKESELVKAYLEENNETWETYMASLHTLAGDSNITDPAASARKIYETFEPFAPVDENLRPEASDGSEERPSAYSDESSSGN